MALNNTSISVTSVLPPPRVAVGIVGPNTILSWPAIGGADFSVLYAPSLTPPAAWLPLPGSPYIYADQVYLADPLTGSNRFYRLAAPP